MVHTIDDVFGSRPVEDTEWIVFADDRGMAVACKDDRIRRRPLEKQALFYSSLRVLCLTNGHLRSEQQADCFRRNLAPIGRLWSQPGPWVYGVQETKVERLRIYDVH